jgi:hypothetical protein
MSKKEDLKILEKRIREVNLDYQRALFDHNYQLASNIKKAIQTLEAQKRHLEENSEES